MYVDCIFGQVMGVSMLLGIHSGLKLMVHPSPVMSIPSRNNPFSGFLNGSWVTVVGDGFLISLYALRISRLWDGQWAILSVILHELKFKV